MWTRSAVGTNVFLRSLIFFRPSVLDRPVLDRPVLDHPFWTARFGPPFLDRPFWTASVLDRPFWSARFGPPVLDRPFWTARFGPPVLDHPFWSPCLGQPIYWSNSTPAARYLEVPHGTSRIMNLALMAPFLLYFQGAQSQLCAPTYCHHRCWFYRLPPHFPHSFLAVPTFPLVLQLST